MLRLSEFKGADGKVDWKAYRKARKECGECCRRCEALILFPDGHPTVCHDCESLDTDTSEVRHNDLIRCPSCRGTFNPHDGDDYDLFAEGEHSVFCPSCDLKFEVSTTVSYSFKSPALESE